MNAARMWQSLPDDIVETIFRPDRDIGHRERSIARCVCRRWRRSMPPYSVSARQQQAMTRFRELVVEVETLAHLPGIVDSIDQKGIQISSQRRLQANVLAEIYLIVITRKLLRVFHGLELFDVVANVCSTSAQLTRLEHTTSWFYIGSSDDWTSIAEFHEVLAQAVMLEMVSGIGRQLSSLKHWMMATVIMWCCVLVGDLDVWVETASMRCARLLIGIVAKLLKVSFVFVRMLNLE